MGQTIRGFKSPTASTEIPRTLTRYVTVMRVLGVVYALVGLGFFFAPDAVFYLMNVGPKLLGVGQPIPDSIEHFWLVLATSMMAMLAAISFLAAESPYVRGYALVHILSKCVSVCGFVYMFFYHQPYAAYLVGVVTDLPIAVVVTWCFIVGPVETNTAAKAGFQEVWYLKLNDPATARALWIRFTLLTSANGFKRVAETWAIHFQRGENREVRKLAMKQTHDISLFSEGDGVLRIGECELSETHTRGAIQSKGKVLRWNLRIDRTVPDGTTGRFNAVPASLARAGIVKNRVLTTGENLTFTGTTEVDGEVREWKAAPGMQSHLAGPKNGHSWVWGHGNAFVNEQGHPVPFAFEGLCARARMAGGMPTPKLSSFYFLYQGKEYRFNSFWDAVRSRSESSLTRWTFQAGRGDISFRGTAKAEHRDFAGITYEDTDGSLLYCANSKLSDLQILVYRRGKLEATLRADGTAAFEVVSRHKNPYVPLLL